MCFLCSRVELKKSRPVFCKWFRAVWRLKNYLTDVIFLNCGKEFLWWVFRPHKTDRHRFTVFQFAKRTLFTRSEFFSVDVIFANRNSKFLWWDFRSHQGLTRKKRRSKLANGSCDRRKRTSQSCRHDVDAVAPVFRKARFFEGKLHNDFMSTFSDQDAAIDPERRHLTHGSQAAGAGAGDRISQIE